MKESLISIRLKELRQRTGLTMPEIAKGTGLPLENLYKWEKGARPSDIADHNKLNDYLDKLENSIKDQAPVLGKYMFTMQPSTLTMRLSLKSDRKPVPHLNKEITAGTVTLINDEPELIVDRIDAPFLGNIEGVVEVIGDSMSPTFKNGSRIAIIRLKNPRLLVWGECYYIIDKNWYGIIKRVYPESEDSIKLISDNENKDKYPPIIRQWDQIEAICKVKAEFLKY